MHLAETKKILVVVESLNVDDSSGAKGRVALIKNLQRAGYDLVVYHYTQKDIQLEGIKCIAIPENRKSLMFFLSRLERQLRHKLNVDLHKTLEKTFGFSFTLFNDRNSIVDTLRSIKEFDPDLILTLSQGGRFRPHHALLKIPEWHHKWIAYIHDPYPMHWYPKPYTWKESGFKPKQDFMMQIADKCKNAAFPSLYLKEWMGSHYGPYSEKGIVIPHQSNSNIPSVKPLNIEISPEEFTLLHAGNLLQARQPQGLIKGFKKFLKNKPDASAKLILMGPAPHYKEYLEKESKGFPSIEIFCENYPFKQVAWLQEKTSVNIIMEAKAEFSPFLPGKFPHCIAAGKPILLIGPPKSETRRLLGENHPYHAEIDDADHIAELLEELYHNWQKGELTTDYSEISKYLSPVYLKDVIENL